VFGEAAGAAGVANDGGASAGGARAGAPYPEQVDPPVSDASSSLPIAGPGGGYRVDGNIPYGDLPEQRLDVMYPTNGGPQATSKSPGVIMFHGGGWIRGDKATMSSFYSRFLQHGFVVCSAEYRVADGDPSHIAPAAVEDALLSAKWFWDYLDYYNVDRSRYVVTGASAGGHLALMVGMATPEAGFGPTNPEDFEIAAIVNGYGPSDVSDLLQRNTDFAVQWLPANTPDRDALAVRLSPVTYVRADMPPLITVQGSDDTTVPVAQSQHLDELLQAAGADADIHLVAGAGHGFSTPASAWPDAEQAMFGFLEDHGIIQ
jgi:acetyl esterase/lipase